ncbi:nuclear transport factor 2 family protein [Mycobacterium sp. CPCC 205372]|uniref:Nuclear transport factor 2 family protein n=1 Tax=Mycobacterium hippophais TaxID=3016340 RepID=A0ABT4PS13_9MYCO|nr:limonene-1,2-epoxide hydrolase family protein [Mycobacterium hippophais]MCZ8379357.1 nuclear transport factor 2 family protein [Mycobacterium hippophais]
MVDPDTVVCTMLDDWTNANRDATKMASHFAEDAIYKPMPALAPVTGRAAIKQFTARILAAFDSVEINIHFQSLQDDIVMNERTDVLRRRDRVIEVPAMGIFRVENGLIVEWRDYSDMGALLDGFNFGSNASPAKTKRFWSRGRGDTVTPTR